MTNHPNIDELLKETKVPSVSLPLHKAQLRQALSDEIYRSPRFGILSPLSHTMKTKIFASTGIAAAALIAIIALAPSPLGTKSAEAQELVRRATDRVELLSAEDRARIERDIKADLEGTLAEARAASDLRVLDKDAFEASFAVPAGPAPSSGAHDELLAPASQPASIAQYLGYTDPQGREVVIGLAADDTVVMKVLKLKEGEMPFPEFHEELR